jgi:hypothetical protein
MISEKNKERINKLRQEIDEQIIEVLKAGKKGEAVITIKMFMGDRGGLSNARVGRYSETVV